MPPDTAAGDEDDSGVEWDRDADGYRLPTERPNGSTPAAPGPRDRATGRWTRSPGTAAPRRSALHEVGGRLPNAWGLYDMLGNVWDWCWDLYDPEVYGGYRVLRGGGWFDEHWSCRAAVRRRSHPTFRVDDVGFRVARGSAAAGGGDGTAGGCGTRPAPAG
ncbi:SUMF1/EgtB/PvdO family nonheme iron enzyme [Streptomyces sp. GKU 257-1]|nr:SUMF1/EgtB/PvdO family nonheme iron enzyme [Streptomyces sp. GKU 257-1]